MKRLCCAAREVLVWAGVTVGLLANLAPAGGQAAPSASSGRARIEAVRTDQAPRVDGLLDEPIWQRAQFSRDFVQRDPREGEAATQRTEFAFVYTDDALYVGARMQETEGEVRALVTRRDREETSDQLLISLDTYRDQRTAYTFGVTAAGVRIDYYHSGDFEGQREYGYDPVWQAQTNVDSAGWTAEIRIPFAQLRFNAL
ncbi:MAG: carbohydrate binding family 9 domain-containing protein, partial [Longimicrobiales bacterium]